MFWTQPEMCCLIGESQPNLMSPYTSVKLWRLSVQSKVVQCQLCSSSGFNWAEQDEAVCSVIFLPLFILVLYFALYLGPWGYCHLFIQVMFSCSFQHFTVYLVNISLSLACVLTGGDQSTFIIFHYNVLHHAASLGCISTSGSTGTCP